MGRSFTVWQKAGSQDQPLVTTEKIRYNEEGIKKVYSIWICMNAPDHIGNAISEYSITKKDKIPGISDVKAAYDKLSVVMICLNPRTGKGVESLLTEMIEKKIKRGKSIHMIADELEEDESVIRGMVEKIQKNFDSKTERK